MGYPKIFATLWEMKKDGYAESTIKTTGKRLRMMARKGVNLNDSNEVKEYIVAISPYTHPFVLHPSCAHLVMFFGV
ncbi:hypothetical protein GWO13_05630 [Candidatus Bathyarchaeota archaeon]|nr:hypothetical protein [Candidatus Bathyarchaeota archaeon]NIW51954.1 hypothetical protein [Candidatus Korarchaeota archaeon]